jgi:hypothetical protein
MSSTFKVARSPTPTRLSVRYCMEEDDVTAIGRPAVFGTATAFIVGDALPFPSRNQLYSHRTCRHCLGSPQQRHPGRSRQVENGSKHRLDLPRYDPPRVDFLRLLRIRFRATPAPSALLPSLRDGLHAPKSRALATWSVLPFQVTWQSPFSGNLSRVTLFPRQARTVGGRLRRSVERTGTFHS